MKCHYRLSNSFLMARNVELNVLGVRKYSGIMKTKNGSNSKSSNNKGRKSTLKLASQQLPQGS